MTWRVVVDFDLCESNAVCMAVAPEVFDQNDDDGVVILLAEHPTAEHHDSAHDAATRCPAAVIEIHETE